MIKDDKLILGGHEFHSRFILGSGKYNPELIHAAVKNAGAESLLWLYAEPTAALPVYWNIYRTA